ncbi:substrate-binding domain-containing protein [Haloferula sp. A504]|uniref:substrate-binding domain-containing protein n=1 Tax=Haloferula sp. A504 TaxID=3373601 RepID=UPI0031CA665F|nr:substrate-binding domain-containing protein [Verrucomicrobiaceae bacterium E54]
MARRKRIAIVIDLGFAVNHHHQTFAGIKAYAEEQGWVYDLWPHAPRELLTRKRKRTYDGIVGRITPGIAAAARRAKVPVINTWISSPVKDVPSVAPDYRESGRMAVRHLVARGFVRFAFLGYRRVRFSSQVRDGFEAAARDAGCSTTSLLVRHAFYYNSAEWDTAYQAMEAWIGKWDLPMGVVVTEDISARYLVGVVERLGLRVPEDVAIIAPDNNTLICQGLEPTLSSIDLGHDRVGYRAAQLLDDLMRQRKLAEPQVMLPPAVLHPRRSTDHFAVADPLVSQALRFITEEGHRPIKVKDVVARVPASVRTLERRFRAVRGRAINDEIRRLRIERVRRLLVESDASLKEVAAECGFPNPQRLCEAFRREYGTSPGAYREQAASEGIRGA